MHRSVLTAIIGAALALAPLSSAQQPKNDASKAPQAQGQSSGVQQAIAYEHAKDRADARQAKLEERHPSVDYSHMGQRPPDDGHHVSDPGELQSQKIKK